MDTERLLTPKEKKNLARLGNPTIRPEALEEYKALMKGKEGNPFSEEGVHLPNGELDYDKLHQEAMGLFGFMINMQWDYFNTLDKKELRGERITVDADFWKNFTIHYLDVLEKTQWYLQERTFDALERGKKGEVLPQEDLVLLRSYFINTVRLKVTEEGKEDKNEGLSTPAFDDLIFFYTRFAKAASDIFYDARDRQMNQEEFDHLISDKSFTGLLASMLANNKKAFFGAVMYMHKNGDEKDFDLNDPSAEVKPELFDVEGVEIGLPVLKMKREMIQRFHEVFEKVAEKHGVPEMTRCPVMFTNKFPEMCDYMRRELEWHLYGVEAPEEVESPENL